MEGRPYCGAWFRGGGGRGKERGRREAIDWGLGFFRLERGRVGGRGGRGRCVWGSQIIRSESESEPEEEEEEVEERVRSTSGIGFWTNRTGVGRISSISSYKPRIDSLPFPLSCIEIGFEIEIDNNFALTNLIFPFLFN